MARNTYRRWLFSWSELRLTLYPNYSIGIAPFCCGLGSQLITTGRNINCELVRKVSAAWLRLFGLVCGRGSISCKTMWWKLLVMKLYDRNTVYASMNHSDKYIAAFVTLAVLQALKLSNNLHRPWSWHRRLQKLIC